MKALRCSFLLRPLLKAERLRQESRKKRLPRQSRQQSKEAYIWV